MKLLLDTHVFIWLNEDKSRISTRVQELLDSGNHLIYLSIVSPWEMQIKTQLGKLSLKTSIQKLVDQNCNKNNLQLLPINLEHINYLQQLKQYHKDPFDRMIIAQAIAEDMQVITADRAFVDYPVEMVW